MANTNKMKTDKGPGVLWVQTKQGPMPHANVPDVVSYTLVLHLRAYRLCCVLWELPPCKRVVAVRHSSECDGIALGRRRTALAATDERVPATVS